ncbi:Glucose-repressible alcohol dehydrogenase, partial [Globisporangium splendens]
MAGSAKPLAVCVGMGVALLASVSIGRHNQRVWKSLQRLSSSSAAGRGRRGVTSLSSSGAAEDGTGSSTQRFLKCAQQLQQVGEDKLSRETITVVQLNILASNLATRNHFPYVVDSSLNWENRKMVLLRQLEELDADVVCLEELSDYWTYAGIMVLAVRVAFFKPELSDRGYDSVFVKRPSIHVSNWSGEKKHDGCGIFFKKVDHQMSELFELEEEVIRMTSDVMDKYERDMADTVTGKNHLPIVLCGDFNNSPESAIYEYMETAFMQKPNLEGVTETFKSAYAKYKQNAIASGVHDETSLHIKAGKKDEPPHTTVNYRRCWTIDYIWYSQSSLAPAKILDIPDESVLRSEEGPPNWLNRLALSDSYNKSGRLPSGLHGNHNGIPNSKFGSDHVPIMAEFEFLRTNTEATTADHTSA